MNDAPGVGPPSSAESVSTVIGDLPSESVGSVIGPYKLLQRIGEGGFGVVYLAAQEAPVQRRVALKIIKPGMDTAQVVARFESERQALALMDHPSIAKVLDAGATGSGHPYFVMELVKGVPITDYCDTHRLPPEDRLKLFVDVCHAIQHAHHKGIIHRDIKPSNVLVASDDGRPVVKVIDFGVAKATVQRLTERTLFTAYGQMIGTPIYMSPEQAEMSGLDIDTRSDVYSLGVLFYELLTGTTPLEAERVREAGYAEMQRMIREHEPPRPSTRLSSLGDSATAIAGSRGLDVKRLVQLLSGDLDWIAMKALEKDRNRRYDTPGALAQDVERYLRQEAILARPPSTSYRFRKFVQRNRASVATAILIAGALVAGAALATWQAVRATRAEDQALQAAKAARTSAEAEKKAKDEAVAAGRAEKKAKEEALARESETRSVLDFVQTCILAAPRPKGFTGGLGKSVTLREALQSSLRFLKSAFPNQPLIEARLRLSIGESFWHLKDLPTAIEQEEAARALYTRYAGPENFRTLSSMAVLANCYDWVGRRDEALKLREQVLAVERRTLGPDDRYTIQAQNNLAASYLVVGRQNEGLALLKDVLARRIAKFGLEDPETPVAMGNVAAAYANMGRPAEALPIYEQALALQKTKLAPGHNATLKTMHSLASLYFTLGRKADALSLQEKIVAEEKSSLGPVDAETLVDLENLATNYTLFGRVADAIKLREETLPVEKAKLGVDHPHTLRTMQFLAETYNIAGRPAEGLKLNQETLALRKTRLGPAAPEAIQSLLGVAQSLMALKRDAEALSTVSECERLAAGQSLSPQFYQDLTDLCFRHFKATKDVAGCRETVARWEKMKRLDRDSLYNTACYHAVIASIIHGADKSASAGREADQECDHAMNWLKQSVAVGYRNVSHMKVDSDLDALRSRADFKKLVSDLERLDRSRPQP
jgi:serine/threonine protein kinase